MGLPMHKRIIAVLIFIVVVLGMPQQSFAAPNASKYQVAGIENDASVGSFLTALQVAVAQNHKQTVASMVDYPIKVKIHGQTQSIRNRAQFLKAYSVIFTPKVKNALASQRVSTLFSNWQGVMIGNGEIWFGLTGNSKQLKITAINN